MNYLKLADILRKCASVFRAKDGIENVQNALFGLHNDASISRRDVVLAMGHAMHLCKQSGTEQANESLMKGFEGFTAFAEENKNSSDIAHLASTKGLKAVHELMVSVLAHNTGPAVQPGGIVARAVFEASNDKTRSMILSAAEAVTRDLDKDNTLVR